MNPKDKVAIVTGGASGLGKATATALAEAGARVAIFDTNADASARAASEIGGISVPCDVGDGAGAAEAVKTVVNRLGTPRILANCAGIGPAGRIVSRQGPMPLAEFERVIRVNLVGTFNVMRLAAAEMIKADPVEGDERGVIVSTASVAGYEGQIGQSAYAASKGGIIALTLPAAREFAQFGVRVLAIAPGLFQTPLLAGLSEEAQQSLGTSIPFPHRLGAPPEFAKLVLACVENAYLNGEVIRLDGALRMAPR